jgi:hypothetical protein
LSSARLASSVPTWSVRKLVAVGIVRLCSIAPASAAAGPLMGVAVAPAASGRGGAGGAAVPFLADPLPDGDATPPASALRTSSCRIMPSGPVPTIERMSRCARAAMRWARCDATPPEAVATDAAGATCAGGATAGGLPEAPYDDGTAGSSGGRLGVSAPSGFRAEVSISASIAPTGIVAPSSAASFATTPDAGAGTSTSTLSVVTSTRVAPSSIHWPGLTRHSTIEPSVTDSPISGRVTTTSVSGTGKLRYLHVDRHFKLPSETGLHFKSWRPSTRLG